MNQTNAGRGRGGPARLLRDRRGGVLVVAAISMSALLGAVALAVDVGLLYTARGEAQKAADAAALAGATSFLTAPTDGDAASDLADEFGEKHTVRNMPVVIEPEDDVVVDVPNERVTVTVRHTADRGNSVPTFFARILDVLAVDVEATATAEAVVVGTVSCLKPFMPPDAWRDANNNGTYDAGDSYETAATGYGSDLRNGVAANNGIDPNGTTYFRDFGRPIVLKEGTPQQTIVPSHYYPITLPLQTGGWTRGASDYRAAISGCITAPVSVGDDLPVEPGNMTGPTRQGVQDLMALDSGARWNRGCNCVTGSRYEPWRASPRVIHIPLSNPSIPQKSGRNEIKVANVTAFWVEGLQGRDVIGRFLFASGVAGGGAGGAGGALTGPAIKAVRLIQ